MELVHTRLPVALAQTCMQHTVALLQQESLHACPKLTCSYTVSEIMYLAVGGRRRQRFGVSTFIWVSRIMTFVCECAMGRGKRSLASCSDTVSEIERRAVEAALRWGQHNVGTPTASANADVKLSLSLLQTGYVTYRVTAPIIPGHMSEMRDSTQTTGT